MADKISYNKIYPKRGLPFDIHDYPAEVQKLWKEKCRDVDEIVASLPAKLSFFASIIMGTPRKFLRALGKRKDFSEILCFSSYFQEPYEFLSWPVTKYCTAYCGPIERLLNTTLKKTVHYYALQLGQIPEGISFLHPEYCVHCATVPNEEGYVNLSVSSDVGEKYLRECLQDPQRKVILEINRNAPWVPGDPEYHYHNVHLSQVAMVYENHEPLTEIPSIEGSDREKQMAEYAAKYIHDGDTLQFGIGKIPNFIASQIKDRRNLGIHTEMLVDCVVDLAEAGAISNTQKGYRDGLSICSFVAGTNRLYDWVDRNPSVCIIPIHEVNSPWIVAKCKNFVSVNASLMVDLHGQACSDTFNYLPYSGMGGQFEFVQGARWSQGGRSILCLKATTTVNEKSVSNILLALPSGATVTVPRYFIDIVITEYGSAELRMKSNMERSQALVNIAAPEFREQLAAEAKKVRIWEASLGFEKTSQKVFYQSIGMLTGIRKRMSLKYWIKWFGKKM